MLFTNFGVIPSSGSNPYFTMVVDTTKAGSASNTFILPLPSTGTYNYSVDWGDGAVETHTTNTSKTHVYTSSGVYTIKIIGVFPRIYFANTGDKLKLMQITNWGNIISNGYRAFYGCSNLTCTANDSLTLSGDCESMFEACTLFNPAILLFSTINVTSMKWMFWQCVNFATNLEYFYVNNVTSMQGMLRGTKFNSSVSNFVTSKVTTFSQMFEYNTIFNQNLANFDTSNATTIGSMFNSATNFNQDVSHFNIQKIITASSFLQLSAFSNANYDLLLVAWAAQTEKPNVSFHAGTAKYSSGAPANARASLLTSGWSILDGGQL